MHERARVQLATAVNVSPRRRHPSSINISSTQAIVWGSEATVAPWAIYVLKPTTGWLT